MSKQRDVTDEPWTKNNTGLDGSPVFGAPTRLRNIHKGTSPFFVQYSLLQISPPSVAALALCAGSVADRPPATRPRPAPFIRERRPSDWLISDSLDCVTIPSPITVFSLLSFYLAKLSLRFSSNEIVCFSNRAQSSRPRTAPEDIPRREACPQRRITVTTPCLKRSVYAPRFKCPLSISGIVGVAVPRIAPQHLFRFLDRFDVEVDGDRLAVAAHQHAFQRLI